MNENKLQEFKHRFIEYQKTEKYNEAIKQYNTVVPVFKEIIFETLKNKQLTNEQLYGLYQMFQWHCQDANFDKNIEICINNKSSRTKLSEKAYKKNDMGWCAVGRGYVKTVFFPPKLNNENLLIIKKFLLNTFNIDSIEKGCKLFDEYESNRISKKIKWITTNIYSPWLFYIQPKIFPIINDGIEPFLEWIGINKENYHECILDYQKLKKSVNAKNLGIIDSFAFDFGENENEYFNSDLISNTDKDTNMNNKNIILYGPPGTGKTYYSIDQAVEIVTGKLGEHSENKKEFDKLRKEGQIEFITFHQNYSYEDFIVGLRPDEKAGTLKFEKRDGIFKKIVDRAKTEWDKDNDNAKKYVLIIDEINRANISRVFGELITLIEDDKRLGAENALTVTLPNGEEDFGIPPNFYIIGTMNTADKSIALVDIALRRRFEFISCYPDYDVLDKNYPDDNGKVVELLKTINTEIYQKKKTPDFLIGHAYFMNDNSVEDILLKKVIPLLMEYFTGKIEEVKYIFKNTDWHVEYDTDVYKWNVTRKTND